MSKSKIYFEHKAGFLGRCSTGGLTQWLNTSLSAREVIGSSSGSVKSDTVLSSKLRITGAKPHYSFTMTV